MVGFPKSSHIFDQAKHLVVDMLNYVKKLVYIYWCLYEGIYVCT